MAFNLVANSFITLPKAMFMYKYKRLCTPVGHFIKWHRPIWQKLFFVAECRNPGVYQKVSVQPGFDCVRHKHVSFEVTIHVLLFSTLKL